MAERSGFWSKFADVFIPGNAYNTVTGRWNPATTKTGLIGMGVGAVTGSAGANKGFRMAAERGWFGSGLSTGLRNEGIYNAVSQQYGTSKQGYSDYLKSIKPVVANVWGAPGSSFGVTAPPTDVPVLTNDSSGGTDGSNYSVGQVNTVQAPVRTYKSASAILRGQGLGFGSGQGGSMTLQEFGDLSWLVAGSGPSAGKRQ